MPRLSLYRPQRTNDYKFFDRIISEQYQVGGLDIYTHKYLGPKTTAESDDATQPAYSHEDPMFIQDLLLLENRDRSYDSSVYTMRGAYLSQDIDFNLTQFGLFLSADTLFITFHYNDMIDTLQRKLMAGDVLEIPNLRDMHPLDPAIPKALPRYYVVQEGNFATEGFSQTWMPHIWRVKCFPLVNSQEYQDVTNKPLVSDQIWDNGNFYPQGSLVNDGNNYFEAAQDVPPGINISDAAYWTAVAPPTIADIAGTRTKDNEINNAILAQAELEVPLSGYDTVNFYIFPTTEDGKPANVKDPTSTPQGNGWTMGYLTGDGVAPNGLPVIPGVSFPSHPAEGTYCLRVDYWPNRLFRFNGTTWKKIEDNVRTDLSNGPTNLSLRSGFVNNDYTTETVDQGDIPSRQSLSELLKPQADNGNQGGNKTPKRRPPGK